MSTPEASNPKGYFPATLWTVIIRAKSEDDGTRMTALEQILTRYHRPVVRHIQTSQRCSPEQAEDLCQDFWAQCLRLDFLKQVGPENGRFRTFIKTCLGNFLRDQHIRATAIKRGGGQTPASLDETDEDGHRLLDPASDSNPPDLTFDLEWALTIVDRALESLEKEYPTPQGIELFRALKGQFGRAPSAGTSADLAARLNMTEGAVNTQLSRMRAKLKGHIETEVRSTIGPDDDWREEVRYLIDLLGRR